MAVTLATDMKVYDPRVQGGYREKLYQNIDAFNAASRGAIVLAAESKAGDYDYRAFWKQLTGIATRRDTTSISAATALKTAQGEMVGVKVNRKIGPVDVALDALRKIGIDPRDDAAQFALGEQVADATTNERVNTGLLAIAAALRSKAGVTYTGTGDTVGTLTSDKLVKGMAKRGDASADVIMWIMHSKAFFDLFGEQLARDVGGIADVLLFEGTPGSFNRPVLVTDSASLVVDNAGTNNYTTLGLAAGALTVTDTESEYITNDIVTGLENLVFRMQGEYAYNLDVLGCAWDVANGGKNPTGTAVGTGTNWDLVAADNKGLGGVAIVSL